MIQFAMVYSSIDTVTQIKLSVFVPSTLNWNFCNPIPLRLGNNEDMRTELTSSFWPSKNEAIFHHYFDTVDRKLWTLKKVIIFSRSFWFLSILKFNNHCQVTFHLGLPGYFCLKFSSLFSAIQEILEWSASPKNPIFFHKTHCYFRKVFSDGGLDCFIFTKIPFDVEQTKPQNKKC